MPTLPWGFSPINALKQVGDAVNPFNGATNYDVFSQAGNQRGQVQGTSTSDPGFGWYDAATGQSKVTYRDGRTEVVGEGNDPDQAQPATTTGARTTGASYAPSNDFYGAGGTGRNATGYTYEERQTADEESVSLEILLEIIELISQ